MFFYFNSIVLFHTSIWITFTLLIYLCYSSIKNLEEHISLSRFDVNNSIFSNEEIRHIMICKFELIEVFTIGFVVLFIYVLILCNK